MYLAMKIESSDRKLIYEYMRRNGYPRLTIKILMSYDPDGMDRLTVILGKGSDYDYRLLREPEFREQEIQRFLELSKSGKN